MPIVAIQKCDDDEAHRAHLRPAEHPRDQVVHAADRDERHPAERAGVHVADRPVGVVRQRVDRLDRHHRTFERRHAVERQRDDQELEDRVVAQLVPRARQRHHPVDHAAPRRREQDQREQHAERLRPVGQRRVVQVMRARPHVGEDQRPEVHHRQAVRIDRAPGLLRHEVVHHPRGSPRSGRSRRRCGRTTTAPSRPARRRTPSTTSSARTRPASRRC